QLAEAAPLVPQLERHEPFGLPRREPEDAQAESRCGWAGRPEVRHTTPPDPSRWPALLAARRRASLTGSGQWPGPDAVYGEAVRAVWMWVSCLAVCVRSSYVRGATGQL